MQTTRPAGWQVGVAPAHLLVIEEEGAALVPADEGERVLEDAALGDRLPLPSDLQLQRSRGLAALQKQFNRVCAHRERTGIRVDR
jgi:hypothetical protein